MEPRAKYTPEQTKKLGDEGKAFRADDGSYSYVIVDEVDVKRAVRAICRGDVTHNSARAYVAKRASAIKLAQLVPENWAADGSLKETKGAWSNLEQRDTANDVFRALEGAVQDKYCLEDGDYYYSRWSVWVKDWYGGGGEDDPWTVVFFAGEDEYATTFTYDDDQKIVLSDEPIKVRPVTTYIERAKQHGETPVEKRRKPSLENTIAMRKARMPKRGEREIRTVPIQQLELREGEVFTKASEDSEGRALLRFVGYASVFDQRYGVGMYEEVITRGAFKRSLASKDLDCVLRMEHVDLPLARTTGIVTLSDGTEQATLTLSEDTKGLRVEALLDPEDPDVQRLAPKMRRQDLNEMSFAFRCMDDAWSEDYGIRTVKTAEIHRGDVSIVTYGASPTTSSTLRSEEALVTIRSAGPAGLIDAFTEWRDHTLLSREARAGKTLSSSTMETLTSVLDLVASADEAVDAAQPLLADLMGVPNPDDTDDGEDDEDRAASRHESRLPTPDYTTRARLQQAALGRGR
jgi:HK97 family phage prohead protease